jgi:hypothetical protein
VKKTPDISAMNRESPMPMGAKNVPLCFSAARRKMVMTSWAVKNISITEGSHGQQGFQLHDTSHTYIILEPR